jgi:hypothetical protein
MIVDCHTHLKQSENTEDCNGHQQAIEPVDYCFLLADSKQTTLKDHKPFSEYIKRNSGKVIGFANINPVAARGKISELIKMSKKSGAKGAVLYCGANKFHPAHSKAMQFYEVAQNNNIPVFFHNYLAPDTKGILDYSQPLLLDEIARKFPEMKIIISNMGFPFTQQTISLAVHHKNVYADLTIDPCRIWQVYNTVMSCYEQNAMEKLLFGSGFPQGSPSGCIETLLGFNKMLGDTNLPNVPRGKIRKIIERNTLELMDISP